MKNLFNKSCIAAFLSICVLHPSTVLGEAKIASKIQSDKPTLTTIVVEGKKSVSNFAYQTRRGPRSYYAGIGLGLSYLNPATPGADSASVDEHWAGGGQLLLGIDFNNRLSGEIHTADLGSAGFKPTGRLNYNLHAISGLVYFSKQGWPIHRTRINGFARLGIGQFDITTAGGLDVGIEDENHTLFGAGLELSLKSALNARLEVVSYSEDARYTQAALLYRFGKKETKQVPIEIGARPITIINAISTQQPALQAAKAIDGDADRDQVPDSRDQCPQTAPKLTVDFEGCAIYAGVVQGVNFNTASHILTLNAKRVLTEVSNTLKNYPDTTVSVVAHTDDQGTVEYNQRLSERRAASVVNFLVANQIERSRLVQSAHGETKPIAANSSTAGRAKNRRVELFAHSR